jgi:2Fe-2S ferredoxin
MPRVRFEPDGIEVEVKLGTTILEAAEQAGAQLGSACGGVCACATCHVYVSEGLDGLSGMDECEEDILDKAFDVRRNSRLACQARLQSEGRTVVTISGASRQTFFDEHPELRARQC